MFLSFSLPIWKTERNEAMKIRENENCWRIALAYLGFFISNGLTIHDSHYNDIPDIWKKNFWFCQTSNFDETNIF